MKKELILIADDSDIVLAFTTMCVEIMGYDVIQAVNGKEAIDKTFAQMPDLIIMDWKMPVMDGLEATKILKANPKTRNIPIIMITGTNETAEYMSKAMAAGVNEFLRKPFDKIELEARIKSQIRQANYIKEIIEIKNNELNKKAIELAFNIDFQNKIVEKLEVLLENVEAEAAKKLINELIEGIKLKYKLNPLNGLQNQFTEINSNFATNLLTSHPNLTPAEIKLSMLLCLNLDTKEIASLSFQTYDSVRVSRTRLREKLNLNPSDNLVNYMMIF